jgi:hypothetical protein
MRQGGGGGGGGRPGGGSPLGGGGAGIGGIGSSIPILGAAVAAMGFAIQKINQIGNAYTQRAAQQLGSTGLGGFRRGSGVHLGAQIGAGMSAFATGTGRFERTTAINQTALDVSTMYGRSTQETFGQAGLFQRAGANYARTAQYAAGAGIQSDLPALMTGLSGILQDAVREGINTSDMSDDIGREITNLALQTPGQSVEAALAMVSSFRGVQRGVASGQMGNVESMYTAQASRNMLMRNLGNTDYVNRLQTEGLISQQQRDAISSMGPNANFQRLQQVIGGAGAQTLLRNQAATANPATLMRERMLQIQQQWGTGAEGFQRFSSFASQQGFSANLQQLRAQWYGAQTTPPSEEEVQARGAQRIASGAQTVRSSAPGIEGGRQLRRENLLFDFGPRFARQALQMEESMMTLARTAAPAVITGMESLSGAITGLVRDVGTLSDAIRSGSGRSAGRAAASFLLPSWAQGIQNTFFNSR